MDLGFVCIVKYVWMPAFFSSNNLFNSLMVLFNFVFKIELIENIRLINLALYFHLYSSC